MAIYIVKYTPEKGTTVQHETDKKKHHTKLLRMLKKNNIPYEIIAEPKKK